jgi:hypothetical protein
MKPLTKAQREVIAKMREGWTLEPYENVTFKSRKGHRTITITKKFSLRGPCDLDVAFLTVRALESAGAITREGNAYKINPEWKETT